MNPATNICIIQGHPLEDSFCAALTNAYAEGAKSSGADIREHRLERIDFDPILHAGYRVIQDLEPGLIQIQQDIKWANHLVLAFPIWWGMPPAKFKGFLDRAIIPGFGFKFASPEAIFQEKRLTGRSARIICTMDSPPWYYRHLVGGPAQKMIKNSVLKFCGVGPVRFSTFGSVKLSDDKKRTAWLDKATKLGRRLH